MISMKLHTHRVAIRPKHPLVCGSEADSRIDQRSIVQGWRATIDDGSFFLQVDAIEEREAVAQALESMAKLYRNSSPTTQHQPTREA